VRAILDEILSRTPQAVFRAIGAVFFTAALAVRLSSRPGYSWALLFWLEAAIPATILAAYLTRPPPVRPPHGASGTLLPLVASVLPFGLLHCPPTAFGQAHEDLILLLLSIPTALMVTGYLFLNRSFAIMAESRELKTGGPYRWIRHPIYAAQLACGLIVLIWRFCSVSAAVYVLFVWAQTVRAREEEAVLAETWPDYDLYRQRTGRFVPLG
jgi:protein-S-isoprenylcysteine O-methyltransferase Ste14